MMDLSPDEILPAATLTDLPPTGYYIPNFITPEEEQSILTSISNLPSTRWTQLTHRRLLSLPSPLTGKSHDTLLSSPLPPFLTNPILPRLASLNLFSSSPHGAPNHVLVNEYHPTQGIMPHEDGPAYHPITATVSLGSHTVLEIYRKTETGDREPIPTWRILQEPRSLLVTSGEMYTGTLHGISEIQIDDGLDGEGIVNWGMLGDRGVFVEGKGRMERGTRVSLTYRDVLKVAKVGGALKFINRR